jgi:hypothetical protein
VPVSTSLLAAQQRFAQQKAAQAQLAQRSRGGQVQGRGVQVGPVGAVRAASQQQRAVQAATQAQNDATWEQAKAQFKSQNKGQQGGGGGIGGFVGGILSNPIVSNVLKPLSVLQVPKNLIQTGVLELEEALLNESDKTPHWMRFMTAKPDQLKWFTPPDEVRAGRSNWELITGQEGEYQGERKGPIGFGSMIKDIPDAHIGPVNVGRIADIGLGFAGDVGLDPLTYTTGGINKIPGATGRLALATEAADKQLSDEVIRAAGQGGARAVRKLGDEAAVEALNLPKAGLRFGGHQGVRIPLTGRLDEALNAVTHGVSGLAADTSLGRGARLLGASRNPATRAAAESLVGRGAEELSPRVAANLVGATWREKAAQGAFTAALENTARDIAKKGKNNSAIVHAVEAGDLSNPVAAALDDLGKQLAVRQEQAGVSVGRLAEDKGGYVQRLITKQGREALEHDTSSFGGKAAFGPGTQQFERVFQPGGKYTIMGKVYEPVKASIEETNAWALKNLGFKLYEDSPAKIAANMVREASESAGKVARLQSVIEGGLGGKWGDRRFTSVDEEATRAASKQAGGVLGEQLEPILRDLTAASERAGVTGQAADEAGQLLRSFDRGAQRAQRAAYGEGYGAANEAEAAYRGAAAAAPDVSGQLNPLLPQLDEARAAEAAAQRPVDQLTELANSGLQGPQMTSPVVAPQMQQLEDQFQKYAGLTKRFLEAGDEGNARQAMLRAKATQEQLQDLTRRYAVPVEGQALPEAEPFQEALQRATGARQGLEEQVGPLQAQQAAHEALGPPPNVDEMVAEQVQPRLQELADARTTLSHHHQATEMANVMAEASMATTERQFDEAIAHLPPPAQVLMKATVRADRSEPAMNKLLGDVVSGKLDDQVVRQANEGYELMRTDRLMGHDIAIDSEMKAALDEADKAMDNFNAVMNKDKGLFGKVVDEYTKFFKAWALATPGQHVRNGMSATFMNMSAGVTFPEMLEGNQIWKVWRRYGGGSPLSRTSLLDRSAGAAELDWVKHLPEDLRAVAPDVVSAVYASGAGGQYGAAELLQRAFGEGAEGSKVGAVLRKTYQNRAITASHNVGEQVEGRVRSGLALHALGKDGSGSWADAVAQVKRIHFDYSDVNELDRGLRRVIPFWTFMSRNLPLQVQQMWTAPRAYSQYQSFMNNVNADPTGTQLMPDWLQRSGAVFLGQGGATALAPDIGPAQIESYLGQIADPKSLLSNVNPIFKDPLQLATGQNFYYGNQYKANDFQQPGFEQAIPSALLNLIGVGKRTKQGVVQERKILDVLRDLNPLTAQANRLLSTTEDREGKGLSSQLSYLGVPVRQVDQAKERQNRMYAQRGAMFDEQDLRDALARFGGAA